MRRFSLSRVRPWLGLLGCLVLALVVAAAVPDPGADVQRRYATAGLGAWAQTRDVGARVTSVAVTRSAAKSYGDPFTSTQALVVLAVDAQVRHRVQQFGQVSLHTRDDHDYEPRAEFSVAGLAQTQPGFTRHATLVFEVPPDRVAGASLVIDPGGSDAVTGYSEAVRIDLDLVDPVRIGPQVADAPESTVTTT